MGKPDLSQEYVLIPDGIFISFFANSYCNNSYKLTVKLDKTNSSMYIILAFLRALFRRNKLFKSLQCLLALATPSMEEFYRAISIALKEIHKRKNSIRIHKEPTQSGHNIVIRKRQFVMTIDPGFQCVISNARYDFIYDAMQFVSVPAQCRELAVLTASGAIYRIEQRISWRDDDKSDYSILLTMPGMLQAESYSYRSSCGIEFVARRVMSGDVNVKAGDKYYL